MKRGLLIVAIVGILAALAVAITVIVESDRGGRQSDRYPSLTEVQVGFTHVRDNLYNPIAVIGDRWVQCIEKIGFNCTKAWYYHAVIIAKNPRSGSDFYFRAGPSEDTFSTAASSPRSSRSDDCPSGDGWVCAIAEPLTEHSVDKVTDILGRHSMGTIRVTYPHVVDRMRWFAQIINARREEYQFTNHNSNTAASALVAYLGVDPNAIRNPTKSFMFLPGWNCKSQLESIGPGSIFYPNSKAGRCG